MRKVPVMWIILLVPAVIGGTWWYGTRDYDFLAEPSATEIETVKSEASEAIARPADIFAVETTPPTPADETDDTASAAPERPAAEK
jgi:hypothetical protein